MFRWLGWINNFAVVVYFSVVDQLRQVKEWQKLAIAFFYLDSFRGIMESNKSLFAGRLARGFLVSCRLNKHQFCLSLFSWLVVARFFVNDLQNVPGIHESFNNGKCRLFFCYLGVFSISQTFKLEYKFFSSKHVNLIERQNVACLTRANWLSRQRLSTRSIRRLRGQGGSGDENDLIRIDRLPITKRKRWTYG